MSETQKDKLGLEQQGIKAPAPSANDVTNILNQRRFDVAYSRMNSPESRNMPDDQWKKVESVADDQIRTLSPDGMPKGELSEADAEKGVKNAEDERIAEFGNDNNPEFQNSSDLYTEALSTEKTLIELKEAIKSAKEEAVKSKVAKPVGMLAAPIFGSIWGIIKGNKFRDNMEKVNQLADKLKEKPEMDTKLQMDKISPNKGHWSLLTSNGLAVGSALTLNPVLGIAALATGVVSIFRTIGGYKTMKDSAESLDDLDRNVTDALTKNTELKTQLSVHMDSYKAGARENIGEMTNFN